MKTFVFSLSKTALELLVVQHISSSSVPTGGEKPVFHFVLQEFILNLNVIDIKLYYCALIDYFRSV